MARAYINLWISAVLLGIALSGSAVASGVDGRSIAFACSTCHGTDGALNKPGLPLLKGQKAQEMLQDLLDFKYDRKRNTIMGRITKGFTDEELTAVVEYFSSLQ